MPLRRALLLLAAVAVACAPGPNLGADAGPTTTVRGPAPSTTSSTTTSTTVAPEGGPPTLPPLPTGPRDDAPVGDIDPIRGRAVLLDGGDAVIRTGERLIDIGIGGFPSQATWSRDGSRLVMLAGTAPGFVVGIVDGIDGTVLGSPAANRPYFFFSWSHDGTRIAALGPGDEATTLDILDADGNLLHESVATAQSLWVAWDPSANRLVAHADERLLRVDADGTTTDFGEVGLHFYTPKWIPGTNEILLVVDIEGTDTLVRRSVDGGDPLTALGPVETETSIVVNPDGRTAALTILFDVEGGGSAGSPVAFGPAPAQEPPALEAPSRSGRVDIIDLVTGERVPVFTGHALWIEWNPAGDALLIGTTDVAAGTGAWWIYEHGDPFADEAAEIDDTVVHVVESYVPTRDFFGSYLVFADQFVEQPRLWSPDGDQFLYPTAATDDEWVLAAGATNAGFPDKIGTGQVAFWSPVE